MKTLSKLLIGIFAFISFLDLYLSAKGLSLGYHESHVLSGLQYGLAFAVMLKCFEIVCIYAFAAYTETIIDEHTGFPVSPFLCGSACIAGFTGASGTWGLI